MGSLREIEEARRWAFGSALPFWATAGVDLDRGGFHEALSLRGGRAIEEFRRLRVTCRQIYAFSHAYSLGYTAGLEVAERGFRYLVTNGWMGPEAGWARLLAPTGRVMDATPDLYDHAFVLFACGWWHRASGDPEALTWAHRTLDFVTGRLRHPQAGFHHAWPARGWRLQNPHMHLLEAALVLYETSGEARFAELACEVATLFTTHFFDERTGTLGEHFSPELRRAPGDDGRVVEPGHHFEWAWILASYQRLLGGPMHEEARALVNFAERYGVDPATGATYNAVRDDGRPIDRGSRTWPNTERIKAHVAMFELDGTDTRVALAQSTRLLLDRYLAQSPAGTWMDSFDGEGNPTAVTIPSATLYHLFLAFAELVRVEAGLRALDQREPARLASQQRGDGSVVRAGG